MSEMEWFWWLTRTLTGFSVGIVLDGCFKYQYQLIYSASHKGLTGRPSIMIKKMAFRHALVFVVVILCEYLYVQRVKDPLSVGMLVVFGLIAVYSVLLAIDSGRELRQEASRSRPQDD